MPKSWLGRAWDRVTGRGPTPREVPRYRMYAGADTNRLTWDWWNAQVQSADQALRGSLKTLRKRSREQVQNNAIARAFVMLSVTNIVGENGFTLQSRVTGPNSGEDVNRMLEREWAQFGRLGNCTVDGRHSLRDVERLIAVGLKADGEFIARIRRRGAWGIQLELIDPDRLDELYDRTVQPGTGNRVVMGVESDQLGRPVAYHILDRHPDEGATTRERVPADQILHLARIQRPGQTRGEPAMAPVLLDMKMQAGLREAVLVAARAQASKSVVYEQSPETLGTDGPVPGGAIPEELSPGLSQLLPPGVEAKLLDPTYPNGNFKDFDSAISRTIAMGLGVSYAALTGDLSLANYSSSRVGLLQERDNAKIDQDYIIEHFHRPLYAAWLQSAVAVGRIRVRGAWDGYLADEWQGRRWAWVDPSKDIEAKAKEVDLRITSRTQIAAEQGKDFRDVVDQIAEEQRYAESKGVTLPELTPAPAEPAVEDDQDEQPVKAVA